MTSEERTSGAVPRHARVDVIGGAVMIGIAALVWYGSIGLKLGKLVNFGPGAMPKVLAAVLFVSGAAILWRGLVQRDAEAERVMLALRPPLILGIAIILFALFIKGGEFWFLETPRLGLMVVGPVTVFIAGLATPESNPRELAVMAFGLTAAMLLVFADLLGVPIPVFPKAIDAALPHGWGVEAPLRVLCAGYAVISAALWWLFFGRGAAGRA